MMFLPGTHARGQLKWRRISYDQAVLDQEIEDATALGEPVYDELKAGEFSLHADMLAHGSDPNRSPRRRCGLTIRYCPPIVRALDPRWAKGSILCRGTDPLWHWAHNHRPPGEDVKVIVQAIGAN